MPRVLCPLPLVTAVLRSRPCVAAPAVVVRGLTLIELMIGVVLMALLMAMALPETGSWVARYRVSGQADSVQAAMVYAKSEAITRGVRVTLCNSTTPEASAPACSSAGSWSDGWLVFVDNTQQAGNTSGVVDTSDTVLRTGAAAPGASASADANIAQWVSFTPDGLAQGSGGASSGNITFCARQQSRSLTLGPTGLASVSHGSC